MVKYCPDCGSSIDDSTLFCPNCNTKIEEEIISSKKDSGYTKIPSTNYPKKTHRKLITVVVLILVMVGIIIGFVLLTISKDDTARFYGTWNAETNLSPSGSSAIWTFYENGSLKMNTSYSYSSSDIQFEEDEKNNTLTVTEIGNKPSIQWYNYEGKGGKLHLKLNIENTNMYSTSDSYMSEFEISYNFINDDKVTLSAYGAIITLTRNDTLTSYSTEPEFKWEDINISVNSGYSYDSETVHWDWINLTRSSIHYYGEHVPSEWGKVSIGDVIEVGKYGSYVYGQITWRASGSFIDNFYFSNS